MSTICTCNHIINTSHNPALKHLRLDNTGAGVTEVNPSLLGNHTTENIDLYIK